MDFLNCLLHSIYMLRISIGFFVFYFLMTQQISAACNAPNEPASFSKLKDNASEAIRIFSNSKIVATEADSTLSKLLAAKSPVIISWISKRNLSKKPEDEVIRAWREYYGRSFVLSKYPQESEQMNAKIEALVDGIIKDYSQAEFKKKTERLFAKAKKAALSVIGQFPLEGIDRTELTNRVAALKLYWPQSLKLARNNARPLDIINWGIAYDPVPNEVNMGLNSWAYPNEETYLSVFAHEIGHAFDSCRWTAFFTKPWPFQKVGKCLRSDSSVAAKKRDDSQMPRLIKEKKVDAGLAQSLKKNLTCNKTLYPPAGFQKDQLPESFADWFSAEVMAHLIKDIELASVRSDLCANTVLSKGSSYPSNALRLNGIYQVHPKIRWKSKTDSKYQYCSMR